MSETEIINLDELNSARYKSVVLDSIEYGKAALTHYFHNRTNGVSKNYKKEALSYVKHALEYKLSLIHI